MRIHDLRNCYGSWLAQNGVSLQQIRDLLGHQSVTTTEIYAHLIPDKFDGVSEALDAVEAKVIDIGSAG